MCRSSLKKQFVSHAHDADHTAVGCSLTLVDTLVGHLDLDGAMRICRELQRYVLLHGLHRWEGAVFSCEANLLALQGRLPAAGRVAVIAARNASREGADDRVAMNAAWIFANTMLELGRMDEDVANAWRSLARRAEVHSDPAWDQLADFLRVKMLYLAGKEGALTEAAELNPTDPYVALVIAPWLARTGLWTGETELIRRAVSLDSVLGAPGANRHLELCRREIAAAQEAVTSGDVAGLEAVAAEWSGAGRVLMQRASMQRPVRRPAPNRRRMISIRLLTAVSPPPEAAHGEYLPAAFSLR